MRGSDTRRLNSPVRRELVLDPQEQTPRNFAVDPTGSYVLAENMSSNTIVVFRVDPMPGAHNPTGQAVEVRSPFFVKFVPIPK